MTTYSTRTLRNVDKPSSQFLVCPEVRHKSSWLGFHRLYFLNEDREHFELPRCHGLLGITTRLRIELAFKTEAFPVTIRLGFAVGLRAFLTQSYTRAYDRSDDYHFVESQLLTSEV